MTDQVFVSFCWILNRNSNEEIFLSLPGYPEKEFDTVVAPDDTDTPGPITYGPENGWRSRCSRQESSLIVYFTSCSTNIRSFVLKPSSRARLTK